jgi:hypothetical protein
MQATTCEYQPTYFPPVKELSYINPSKGHRSGEGLAFLNSGLYKEYIKRPSTDIVLERLHKYLSKRLIRLGEIFEQKLPAHLDDFIGIDLDVVRMATIFTAQFCLLTSPERFTVDFTEDASVALTLCYAENRNAYLGLYFEPGVSEPIQHNVLIFKNKENVFAYSGGFQEGLSAFMQEMSPISIQVPA